MSGVPDMVGEVVAWRAWTVVEPKSRHPRLRSATQRNLDLSIWPTNRWFLAECPYGGHSGDEIPGTSCSCGLYAAKELEHLLAYGYALLQPTSEGVTAIGEVGFAGKIVEGSQGYRAQRGRVRKLYLPFSQADLAAKLGDAYGVPFELVPWWATDRRLLRTA